MDGSGRHGCARHALGLVQVTELSPERAPIRFVISDQSVRSVGNLGAGFDLSLIDQHNLVGDGQGHDHQRRGVGSADINISFFSRPGAVACLVS